MVNVQTAQELSKFMSRALADKGVKQSEVLELMAQFNNFKDWNTYKAIGSKPYAMSLSWGKEVFANVDNGGFFFNFDEQQQLLSVSNSFFGYSDNLVYVPMTKKELGKVIHAVKTTLKHDDNQGEEYREEGENWSVEGQDLSFYQQNFVMHCSLRTLDGNCTVLPALEELMKSL